MQEEPVNCVPAEQDAGSSTKEEPAQSGQPLLLNPHIKPARHGNKAPRYYYRLPIGQVEIGGQMVECQMKNEREGYIRLEDGSIRKIRIKL